MARHYLARRALMLMTAVLVASGPFAGCSTGVTLVGGQDPFAPQNGNTTAQAAAPGGASSAAQTAGGGSSSATPVSSGNTTTPNTPAASGQPSTVGVEVDGGGGALDLGYWSGSLGAVTSLVAGAPKSVRLVVGSYSASGVALAYADDGTSALPTGRGGVTFTGDGGAEALLTLWDQAGVKVVVEVQPGALPLPTLAAEVLKHYSGHVSVVGVGLNLAYYGSKSSTLGSTKLSDQDAAQVVAAVQKIAPQALVTLRHYNSTYMPPTARSGLAFTLDAQGFASLADMSQVYGKWAGNFAPATVQYVLGGAKDQAWACQLTHGAQDWIAAAQSAGNNVSEVVWAAGTVGQLYPNNIFSCLNGGGKTRGP